MTRLAQLTENQLEEVVAEIARETEELKKRQFTGTNNLVIHHVKSANTWDLDELVLGTVSYVQWRVTLTPDNVSRPFSQFQFNFDAYADNEFIAYVDPLNIDSSAVSFLVEMNNLNPSDANVRMKFAFKSLDTGSISVVRVFEI